MNENKQSENIVKKVCRELGLTYRELGERIGYSESAIKTAIANDNVSEPMKKAIEMYLQILELEQKLDTTKEFKKFLKDFLRD